MVKNILFTLAMAILVVASGCASVDPCVRTNIGVLTKTKGTTVYGSIPTRLCSKKDEK